MLVLKNVLKPRLKPSSSGGGRVPTRQVPYRQNRVFMYRMGTSQGSSPDYFKGQSHTLFKARTTWTWMPVVDHIPSRSVHL